MIRAALLLPLHFLGCVIGLLTWWPPVRDGVRTTWRVLDGG